MTRLNIYEAKTNFSKYLRKVQAGEEVVICKNGEPIAQIIPFPTAKRKSIIGLFRGKGQVTDKFFEPLTEEDLPGMGLD